jgi:S1-C subfamily serine protease
MTVTVTLEVSPETVSQMTRYESTLLELTVRDVAFDDRVDLQLDPNDQGVYVERVQRAGWTDLAGIVPGDLILSIDGQSTPTVKEVEAILEKAEAQQIDSLVFFMQRGIYTQYVQVKVKRD